MNPSKWLPVIEDAALTGAAALLTYLIAHVGDLPLGTLAPVLVVALTVLLSAIKAHLPQQDDSPPSDRGRAVLPFLLALGSFALLAAPAPAQLFGGWRTAVLLDHERRISTLEGKANATPPAPAPIVIPPAPSAGATTPAPIQPIIITPPASTSQPAAGPLVFVVPGNGASGPNPQPIPATGANPQPIPATGPNPQPIPATGLNPQPIPATGTNPQPIPATGANPQPIPAAGSNPQPIAPKSATNPQPLPTGLTPPAPASPMPPAVNPQVIPATSGYYRAYRYPNGTIVYLWTR